MVLFEQYKKMVYFEYNNEYRNSLCVFPCLNTTNDEKRLFIGTDSWKKKFLIKEKVAPFLFEVSKWVTSNQMRYAQRDRAITKWTEKYHQNKDRSIVFQTLTHACCSKMDIRRFIDVFKKYLKANSIKVESFFWVLELKRRIDTETGEIKYHPHYHVLWAISNDDNLTAKDRVSTFYRANYYWGNRTNNVYIEYSAKRYLRKYLKKRNIQQTELCEDLLCVNWRIFGSAR